MAINRYTEAAGYREFFQSRGGGLTLLVHTFGDYMLVCTGYDTDYSSSFRLDEPDVVESRYLATHHGLIRFFPFVEVFENRQGVVRGAKESVPRTAHSVYSYLDYDPTFINKAEECINAIDDPWLSTAFSLWKVQRMAEEHERGHYDARCAAHRIYPAVPADFRNYRYMERVNVKY